MELGQGHTLPPNADVGAAVFGGGCSGKVEKTSETQGEKHIVERQKVDVNK
jgi:hypothetical protein